MWKLTYRPSKYQDTYSVTRPRLSQIWEWALWWDRGNEGLKLFGRLHETSVYNFKVIFVFLCPPAECSVMTVYYVYSMFISHPCLLCFSANWRPAAPGTPVVFNWQIDSAVCKPGHLQETPDLLVVKCHRVTKHQADHNVALWPDVPGRTQTQWQIIHYMFEPHELWMVEKIKTFPTLYWEGNESQCFPWSHVISVELRSKCISSTHVHPGQRERQQECVLCVLREGCVRTPRLLQHTVQTLRQCFVLTEWL